MKNALPLKAEEVRRMNAYWRAANYLSVGQIYLYDNPLLKEPLKLEHIKPRLLGHWGTTPGLNFIYAHCNRIIKKYDLDMIYVAGPGHGGPGLVANTYLEGTYSEFYSHIPRRSGGARAPESRRVGQPFRRVWLPAVFRGGRRSRGHAPAYGWHAGPGDRGDSRHRAGLPPERILGAPPVAARDLANAQRLDRS